MAIPFLEMKTEAHNGFMTCSMLHRQFMLGLEVGPQIGALHCLGQGHAPRWDTEEVFYPEYGRSLMSVCPG